MIRMSVGAAMVAFCVGQAAGAASWQGHAGNAQHTAQLTAQNRLYFPASAGTVFYRDNPDQVTGTFHRVTFFGSKAFNANPAAYKAAVDVDTPLTSDASGNLFYGFTVTGSTPINLQSG